VCGKAVVVSLTLLLLGSGSGAEKDIHKAEVLEQDRDRIKLTGDLRSSQKLFKATVELAGSRMVVSGNERSYRYITIIPYSGVGELLYSEIAPGLPDILTSKIPLFLPALEGGEQNWLQVSYTSKRGEGQVRLLLRDQKRDRLVQGISSRTEKAVVRFADGYKVDEGQAIFSDQKVLITGDLIEGFEGRHKCRCQVAISEEAFIIRGLEKRFSGALTIKRDQILGMTYERAHRPSAGQVLMMGAFWASKIPQHWFIVDFENEKEEESTVLLQLKKQDARRFRRIARRKTGLDVEVLVD